MPYWLGKILWPYLIITAITFIISSLALFKLVPRTRLNGEVMLWMGTGITLSVLLVRLLAYTLGMNALESVFSKSLTLGVGPAMVIYGVTVLAMLRGQ